MGKKKKKYKNVDKLTLLKYVKEVFEQQEFNDFNEVSLIDRRSMFKGNLHVKAVPFVKKDKSNGFAVQVVDVCDFSTKHKIKTIDEQEWKDKSFNTFFSSWVNRVTVVVEKTEDKLKLSIFKYGKSRSVGHKYFKKVTNATHLTFNTTTNNFFITSSKFINRKKQTSTVKNSYKKLHNVIGGIDVGVIVDKLVTLEDVVPFGDQVPRTNSVDYVNMSKEIVNILCKELDVEVDRDIWLGDALEEITSKWYIKVRGIKVPNEHFDLMKKHYPGIRKLKRFGMNLVDTILHYKGLKGKFYKKLLNDGHTYNLTDLMHLNNMVGEKRIKSINKGVLRLTHSFHDDKYPIEPDDMIVTLTDELTEMERTNIFKLINNLPKSDIKNFLGLMVDHLIIKGKLTKYGANVKVRCRNLNTFNIEHQEWSNMVHTYSSAEETRYHYEDSVLDIVEKDIDINGHIYNVSLLKTDMEYYEEGKVQSHCVRTYVDSYDSMVISVRDGEDVLNRMTMEFKYGKDKKTKLIQSRMRFNKDPEGMWEELIGTVSKRVLGIKGLKSCKIGVYNKLSGKTRFVKVGDKTNNQVFYLPNDDLPF
jgi:hypothetical protein|tara:strand:- start:608 stop:2365 length:1758 start_codon:yes stop_codon:yes gene_type:complete